jgi:hypothetical protein
MNAFISRPGVIAIIFVVGRQQSASQDPSRCWNPPGIPTTSAIPRRGAGSMHTSVRVLASGVAKTTQGAIVQNLAGWEDSNLRNGGIKTRCLVCVQSLVPDSRSERVYFNP